MKRLVVAYRSKSRLKKLLKKAEWMPIEVSSPDIIQIITDAMASGVQIQIEYQGSGWRLIQPYGWNTSKAGNILLMCYKDTGEIRSYRLDRILQVLVDDTMLDNQPVINNPEDKYEVSDYSSNPEDFEIPELPNMDEILEISENEQGSELPYDDALDYLTEDVDINDDVNNDIEETDQNER